MDILKNVLKSYSIQPIQINRITDKLFHVHDGHYHYGLKKSSLSYEEIKLWENVFHQANAWNLAEILPVYLTSDNLLYSEMDGVFYYVMPWLGENAVSENLKMEQLFRAIGIIHAKTKQSRQMDDEKAISHYEDYRVSCKKIGTEILGYVEHFEKNRYMSPFELLVCTQYRDIVLVLMELDKCIVSYLEELPDLSEWNFCLNHGQLHLSHMVYHEQTYFINWEKACYDHPVKDIAGFFLDYVCYYDQHADDILDSFLAYMKKNELEKADLHLLSIHLLDPGYYVSIIRKYNENRKDATVIDHIKTLQHASRKLAFGLEWIRYAEKWMRQNNDKES